MEANKMKRMVVNAINETLRNGGALVPLSGQPVPVKGYMVSLDGYETHVTGSDPVSKAVSNIQNIIKPNIGTPGTFLGGWRENGIAIMDISICIADQQEALRFAKAQNQRAIYDIGEDKIINF